MADGLTCVKWIQMHRWILRESSDYFKKLFRWNTKQKKSGKLSMTDTSEETVEAFKEFVYSSRLPSSCHKSPGIADVFIFADK